MGGRGGSSGGGGSAQKKVVAVPPAPGLASTAFGQLSDADALAMIKANQDAYSDPDFIMAQKLYISSADIKGDGFSFSQNLNYKLDNGIPLDANESWINNNLQSGMHPLGKNAQLVRYCHDDILQKCGVADYSKLTNAQLQQKLVGKNLQSSSYISTSYNASKSPFSPNAPLGGGREVIMKIKASKSTKVVLGAKAQTEVVLNKGTNMRITGIKFDGSYANPRNKGQRPRVVLEVETY